MFYEVGEDGVGHKRAGFDHNPFNSLVVPRPIGWISTVDAAGAANLSPYSFFNAVSSHPPIIMFCANGEHAQGGEKDSLRNVRETGEFVFNLCTEELLHEMSRSSVPAPHGMDEFEIAGLTKVPSRLVKVPRVAESPVHIECRVAKIVELPAMGRGGTNNIVIGNVVAIHIRDDLIVNGRVNTVQTRPVGRLGYFDYCVVSEAMEVLRPRWPLNGGNSG